MPRLPAMWTASPPCAGDGAARCGIDSLGYLSDDELSVLFSKMDQPSTTGPSSSSLSTTVKGEEMCVDQPRGHINKLSGEVGHVVCRVVHKRQRVRAGGGRHEGANEHGSLEEP